MLSDNVSGAYQLTETILRTGRREIAFVGSVNATSSIMDRYLGYTKALLRAGLEPRADWRLEDCAVPDTGCRRMWPWQDMTISDIPPSAIRR